MNKRILRLLRAIRARDIIRGSQNAEPLVRGKVRPLVDPNVIFDLLASLDHLDSPTAETMKKIADSNGNSGNRHAFLYREMTEADRKAADDLHIAKMMEAYNEAELEQKDVVVLKDGNFSEFVENHHFVMVAFYSPSCDHCKAFAPEYAAAATRLKDEDVEVVLAKVDMTEERGLDQKYDLQGFGTVYVFVDGDHKPFLGKRTKDGLIAWIKKMIGSLPFESSVKKQDFEKVLPELQQAAKHFKRKKCWTDKQRNTQEQWAAALAEFRKRDASLPFNLQKPTSPKSEVSDAKEVQESSSGVKDEL